MERISSRPNQPSKVQTKQPKATAAYVPAQSNAPLGTDGTDRIDAATLVAVEREQRSQKFLKVALASGEDAPRGQALDVIREYVNTDFGAEMVDKVLEDHDKAEKMGLVDDQGRLTEEGEFAGFTPFKIAHSKGSASASLREIRLPEKFSSHFAGSKQEVLPIAILHHEFGHTQFGQPASADDIVTDAHGSRLKVDHEMEIVRRFENPVRQRYGYAPRESYHNHLGEVSKGK